jgi:hypothetical protein
MSGPGYRVPPNYPQTPNAAYQGYPSTQPLINNDYYHRHARTISVDSSYEDPSSPPPSQSQHHESTTHHGVQTGEIGGGYGPYTVS